MLVFITARAVGNRINEGIYDTQISIKKMPFLKQVSSYSLIRLPVGVFCCAIFAAHRSGIVMRILRARYPMYTCFFGGLLTRSQ